MYNELVWLLSHHLCIYPRQNDIKIVMRCKYVINKMHYLVKSDNDVTCYISFCQNNTNSYSPLFVTIAPNSKKSSPILAFRAYMLDPCVFWKSKTKKNDCVRN